MQNISYILGAGSSCNIGYPSGEQLKRSIFVRTADHYKKLTAGINMREIYFRDRNVGRGEVQKISYYDLIVKASEQLGIKKVQVDEFHQKLLRESDNAKDIYGSPSIDAYLSNESIPEFVLICKLAIALTILDCEGASNFNQKWQEMFLRKYYPIDGNAYNFRNTVIITYNYDRSLEYILYKNIINQFNIHGKSKSEIKSKISELYVVKPKCTFQSIT